MNYFSKITARLTELIPDCPDEQILRYYALLVLAKGSSTTMEDVHDAWSAWTAPLHPDHRSLVPFRKLAFPVQELDRKYMLVIHQVAAELEGQK